jgi:outer membrane protein assembly factor BamB
MGMAAAIGLLALAAAACAGAPGPRGWAGARPVEVGTSDKVLAAHKSRLYALTRGSTNIEWQFPPRSRDNYPLSERAREALQRAVEDLSADGDVEAALDSRIADATVSGPPLESLENAIRDAALDDAARNDLRSLLDDITDFEEDALRSVRGLYGSIAVSEDGRTAYVPAFGGYLFALDVSTGQTRWIADTDGDLIWAFLGAGEGTDDDPTVEVGNV